MTARPAVVVLSIAAGGGFLLLLAAGNLPPWRYGPAAFGSLAVLVVALRIVHELQSRDRWSIAGGAAALGFFVAAALTLDPFPWSTGFAAAFGPLFVLLLAGVGRERLTYELSRLEDACDEPTRRPAALSRARKIRDDAAAAARAIDPDAETQPLHAGDARAVYAYAAQVVAYAHAKDSEWEQALASLDAVPRIWMPGSMRALMLSNIAFWRLCAADVPAAQRAMEEIAEKDALPEVRPIVRATRAAILVRTDRVDEALEIVGKSDGDAAEPEMVRGRYRMARAHALVAKGDVDGARTEIERSLAVPSERAEIEEWLPAGGPAADLMREMIEASATA